VTARNEWAHPIQTQSTTYSRKKAGGKFGSLIAPDRRASGRIVQVLAAMSAATGYVAQKPSPGESQSTDGSASFAVGKLAFTSAPMHDIAASGVARRRRGGGRASVGLAAKALNSMDASFDLSVGNPSDFVLSMPPRRARAMCQS
jgi:hypothetical protein